MPNGPLLEMKQICKRFPGVQALRNVSIAVCGGEIHALIGENGAGKSTLMKILAGVYPADSGEIYLNGHRVKISNLQEAQKLGISIIFQEFNLIPHISIGENIFFGRFPQGFCGRVNWDKLFNDAKQILTSLEIGLDPRSLIKDLSVADQQMVEIAKVLSLQSQVLIMDEPTSALTQKEIDILFALMKKLKNQGVAIIFISHRLEEVKEIADRITILRDGEKVCTAEAKNLTREEIANLMVGREMETMFPKQEAKIGQTILEIKNFCRKGKLNNISFCLRRGEILGIYGLVGAGRTELARAIFGEDSVDTGDILIEEEPVTFYSPYDAVHAGIGMVPEDRSRQGLLLTQSVEFNISLPSLINYASFGKMNKKLVLERASKQVKALNIKTPSLDQKVMYLSGGNQQKVVLAKWLELEPRILILDEPTRGIDVGAKAEIYSLISNLAQKGFGVIMISSELPEILGMSDRILVMNKGRITAQFNREEAEPQKIIMAAAGRVNNESN